MQCRLLSCCSRLALSRLTRSNVGNRGDRAPRLQRRIVNSSRRRYLYTKRPPDHSGGRRFSEAGFVLLRARTRRSFLALFLSALWLSRRSSRRRFAARSTAGLPIGTLPSLPPTLHFTGSGTSSGSSARLLLISALASLPSTPCFTRSRTSR